MYIKKGFSLPGIFLLTALIFYLIGYHFGIGNQSSNYGKTGLPKNCRALITENLTGAATQKYTAEEALDSISRNCGPNGLIWDQR